MDILNEGGHKNAASNNELAKAMFEGTHQYRRKLKLPEMNEYAEKIKTAVRRRAASSPMHRSPPCFVADLVACACSAVCAVCRAGGGQG